MNPKEDRKKRAGAVRTFRRRVAAAEAKLQRLRAQHLLAKRRRKEAKRRAQRARKAFKRFKAGLGALKQALARAETKLFQAGRRAPARKAAPTPPAAQRGVGPTKKTPAAARPAVPRAARVPRRAVRKKPPTPLPETQTAPAIPVEAAAPAARPATPPLSEPKP